MDRKIVVDILLKYVRDHSYLNLTLNETFKHCDLSRESKDFITRVVYGTVQYWLTIEFVLAPFIKGKVKNFEKVILYMSMYQHLYMDAIPDYAIVNEAVNLAKKKSVASSRFINAVLNNAFQHHCSFDNLNDDLRLSIETSHPLWMVKMFIKQYGFDKTQRMLNAFNEVPIQCARLNLLKTTKSEFLKCYPEFVSGKLCEDAVYYQKSHIASHPAFKKGLITIQDESSQCVARLLNPTKDDYVLDMCCAPGSKTSHLAMLMENKGRIDAYDLYEHKISLVNQQMQRLGICNVFASAYDSTCLINMYQPETFDKILLDAPCSGLGVMARKPEIKYHDSNAMDEIIQIQAKLLENAYVLLKKGGKIVYSTCTINKKENEKQIAQWINMHPDMHKVEEKTILPYEYHSDGFYMCLLVKE